MISGLNWVCPFSGSHLYQLILLAGTVQQSSPCMESGLLLNGTQSENVTCTTATSTPLPALKKSGRSGPAAAILTANGHYGKQMTTTHQYHHHNHHHHHLLQNSDSRSKSLQNISTKFKFFNKTDGVSGNGKSIGSNGNRKGGGGGGDSGNGANKGTHDSNHDCGPLRFWFFRGLKQVRQFLHTFCDLLFSSMQNPQDATEPREDRMLVAWFL